MFFKVHALTNISRRKSLDLSLLVRLEGSQTVERANCAEASLRIVGNNFIVQQAITNSIRGISSEGDPFLEEVMHLRWSGSRSRDRECWQLAPLFVQHPCTTSKQCQALNYPHTVHFLIFLFLPHCAIQGTNMSHFHPHG